MDAAKLTALEKEELGASFFLMLNVMKMVNRMNCEAKKMNMKGSELWDCGCSGVLAEQPYFFSAGRRDLCCSTQCQ